jgi:hypothetical protein
MKRLLVLSLLAGAAAALAAPRVRSQPGDDFTATLQARPAKASPPRSTPPSTSLPAGVEPVRPAGTATAPAAPNPYPLPPDAPPFLICAAAFSGPDGADLARQVCAQLRKKGLTAYVYNRGDEERRRQDEEWERMKAAYPGVPVRKKGVRIVDNYAVLVAGWRDFQSASEHLAGIKKLPMPELTLPNGRPAYDVQAFQEIDPNTGKPSGPTKQGRVNPYHSAMVTRNPLAPGAAAASRPKFDPFWKKLNADEEYSLLACRGKYTLLVKEYTGMRTFQEPPQSRAGGFLEAIGLKGKSCDMLDAAAAQAHELAKLLRDRRFGFKAFVLHTRNASLVTVGEFRGPDDPEMQRVLRQLASLKFNSDKNGGGPDPIGLLAQPLPVEVPRP